MHFHNSGELYFGDEAYGNEVIHKTLGGVGGGYLTIVSRHVDIDGLIAANGLAPDSRFDQGAGTQIPSSYIFIVIHNFITDIYKV